MRLFRFRLFAPASAALLCLFQPAFGQDNPDFRPQGDRRGGENDHSDIRKDKPRDQANERLGQMKRKIQELREAGRPEEADQLQAKLMDAVERRDEGRPDKERPTKQAPERIRHIQEAIRHLRMAGLNEPAQYLEQTAEKMRDEFQRSHSQNRRPDGQREDDADEDDRVVAEIKRQLDQTHEQMKRMANEVQELRAAVRKLSESNRRPDQQ